MKLASLLNPWKRAAALERENERLLACLEYEAQRNFDYMYRRMEIERNRFAQIEAMNKHLMNSAVDLANLSPRGPIIVTRPPEEK